ncbi:MAG: phytoene desaturase family protein [Bacteroidia bacterium]
MATFQADVIVIGSGFAGLTTASLCANEGKKVIVLEKNWLPGGCSSSYPRKHYIFESGATTLVGLDENMSLRYLLDTLKIEIPAVQLATPMQVHLADNTIITRYQPINQWIEEAERVFGKKNQRAFWEHCYQISQAVWKISLQQKAFPPSSFSDLMDMAVSFRPFQLKYLPFAFQSMKKMLQKFDLLENERFIQFIDEQLLITAQNTHSEVNALFGATALCYTNYGNYYVNGGLLNLVQPFVDFIQAKGGEVKLREGVEKVITEKANYQVFTKENCYLAPQVVSAIPINDTLPLFAENTDIQKKYEPKLLKSEQLNGAFTMGAVFKKRQHFDCLHHQIHLASPLPYTDSASIFVSISHPDDRLRCPENEVVINISTHVPHPKKTFIEDKTQVENAIFDALEKQGLFQRSDLIFHHSSTPKSWKKWTSRQYGFVGGYPQYLHIKPWQMLDARLDGKGAYLCGDSTYPGQGIPGVCLSGIIAHRKMQRDDATQRRIPSFQRKG